MKASELRIGNLIERHGLSYVVTAWTLTDFREDYCKPIPLTPEILEKAGFDGELPEWIVSVHDFQNWYYWNNGKKEIELNINL